MPSAAHAFWHVPERVPGHRRLGTRLQNTPRIPSPSEVTARLCCASRENSLLCRVFLADFVRSENYAHLRACGATSRWLRGLGRCAPCRPCLHENYPLRGPFSPAPVLRRARGRSRWPMAIPRCPGDRCAGGHADFSCRPARGRSSPASLPRRPALRFGGAPGDAFRNPHARPLTGPGARASPPLSFCPTSRPTGSGLSVKTQRLPQQDESCTWAVAPTSRLRADHCASLRDRRRGP